MIRCFPSLQEDFIGSEYFDNILQEEEVNTPFAGEEMMAQQAKCTKS